jgi:phage gp46-like protein
MTDVLLRQTNDGGDITVDGGLMLMSDGLETAAFLSLFGGNEQDGGESDSTQQWWGNVIEPEPTRRYRSETQYLIRSLPAVPSNLRRIEQAAARDLDWMISTGIAKSIVVAARIPNLDRVTVNVIIVTLREQIQLSFG